MIGVALVGFITIFAASAKASISAAIDHAAQDRLHHHHRRRASAPPPGSARRSASSIAQLPEIETRRRRVRLGQVGINEQSHVRRTPPTPRPARKLFDLDSVAGSLADLERQRHRDLEDARPTTTTGSSATTIPVTFVEDRQGPPLTVALHLQGATRSATTSSRSTTYEKNFTEQLDFLDLRQAEARRHGRAGPQGDRAAARSRTRPPSSRTTRSTRPTRSKQVNQLLDLVYVLLFLAVIIALIGIANTLALSIYERTRELGLLRAVGESRRQVRSTIRWESVIIALLGTLLGLVIGAVLRLGRRRGAAGRGLHQVLDRRPVQLLIIVVIARLVRACVAAILPGAPRGASSTSCDAISQRVTRRSVTRRRTAPGRAASLSRTCSREVGLVVLHRGAQLLVARREDAHREQAGVAGVADRDRRDRDAARHLHDRQQRVEPVELRERHRHADHRQRRHRRGHARQVRGAAGARDDHPQAAVGAPIGRTRT